MPTIPPYIPGATIIISGIVTAAIGLGNAFSPEEANRWTDRGTILALLGLSLICIAILFRYIVRLHSRDKEEREIIIKECTAVNRAVLEYLIERKEFDDRVTNRVITDRLEPNPRRTRVHSQRVHPRDLPKDLPKAEDA